MNNCRDTLIKFVLFRRTIQYITRDEVDTVQNAALVKIDVGNFTSHLLDLSIFIDFKLA
jgi:hypothetical protein